VTEPAGEIDVLLLLESILVRSESPWTAVSPNDTVFRLFEIVPGVTRMLFVGDMLN
jgi:hypothetical protein